MPTVSHTVSAVLSGSWRVLPDPASVPAASLAASLPVLTSTGAAGLAWNRVKRNASLSGSSSAQDLHRHALALVLEATRHEAALEELARFFDGAGMAPLHFKGWAAAQSYAEPHSRAMGDADLCAPPGQFDEMSGMLRNKGFHILTDSTDPEHGRAVLLMAPADWPGRRLLIDLHERLDKFYLGPLEDVFARARTARLGAHAILVPAAEDHLRLVAIHFLRDGGWRPSALCDVGAQLESRPAGFDWELCLGAHPRRRHWIACTFELAHELLGARLDAMPRHLRVPDPPSWLSATVRRAWNKPLSHHGARVAFGWIARLDPSSIPTEALARWPNGIRASIELEAPFTRVPRWPYQLLHFARGIGRFAWRGVRAGVRREPS